MKYLYLNRRLVGRRVSTDGNAGGVAAKAPDAAVVVIDTLRKRAVDLVRARPEVTTAEMEQAGISRQYLAALTRRDVLRRIRHGVYGPNEEPIAIDSDNKSQ